MARGLTLKQERFLAAYIGDANGDATAAARQAGYRGNTVTLASVGAENLRKPQIAAAVAEYRAAIKVRGIDSAQKRVAIYADMAERLRAVINARAADPDMQDVPGGPTGLLVRTTKGIGGGDNFQTVDEYKVDAGTLEELRATLQQAAQEQGQWVTKVAPTDPTGTTSVEPHAELVSRLAGLIARAHEDRDSGDALTGGDDRPSA